MWTIARALGLAMGVAAIAAGGAAIALISSWSSRDDSALVESLYERVRDRAEREATARMRFPELTAEEVASLEDQLLQVRSFVAEPTPTPIPREPGADWRTPKLAGPDGGEPVYVGAAGKPVPVDETLPLPAIEIAWEGKEPTFRMSKQFRAGTEALYYWEVDTTPAFDSPNLWRAPMLMPAFSGMPEPARLNLTGRAGMPLALLTTQRRDEDGSSNVLRFPFRASAMRLPSDWAALDFEAMRKQARALTYGLTTEDAIAEVFRYVRQVYPWASDNKRRAPLDTFRAGLGECGHVNDLMGAFLELNGIRYRNVSAFNPSVRALRGYEGGGHSAIEAYVPAARRWAYLDPYLDILALDGSVKDLVNGHPLSRTPVYEIAEASRSKAVPAVVTVADLFKMRVYNDKRGRLPPATMFELQGAEASYGMSWDLDVAPTYSPAQLFPEEITLYVRGRYMLSDGVKLRHPAASPQPGKAAKATDLRLSPWSVVEVKLRPREILTASIGDERQLEGTSMVATGR